MESTTRDRGDLRRCVGVGRPFIWRALLVSGPGGLGQDLYCGLIGAFLGEIGSFWPTLQFFSESCEKALAGPDGVT